MNTHETWKPVPGYEGAYEVSDQGRVRSLDREVWNGRVHHWKQGRVMSIHHGDKYAKVRLKLDGTGKTHNVHTLVAVAFLGPRPDGLEVCHGNGDAHDNRLTNLRYDTHSANQYDNVANGTHHLAARTHCNKGHEFTAENTMPRENGSRRCRTCDNERHKRRSALNTTCKSGHPLDGTRQDGRKFCTTCARNAWATHHARKETA